MLPLSGKLPTTDRQVATVEIALAFTKLFWLDFVEHDTGIFLAEAFNQEIYEQWKAELGNDIVAIERVMNHQHIDAVSSSEVSVSPSAVSIFSRSHI
jgi:hypothetical protein